MSGPSDSFGCAVPVSVDDVEKGTKPLQEREANIHGEEIAVMTIAENGNGSDQNGSLLGGETEPPKLSREKVLHSILQSLPPHMSQHHHEVALNAVCQVEGCHSKLCHLREYHQRYRVCIEHLKCDYIIREGKRMRFCQQCGKFQDLAEFDKGKRSCRERLKKHNERRRRRIDVRYAAALALQMSEQGSQPDDGQINGAPSGEGIHSGIKSDMDQAKNAPRNDVDEFRAQQYHPGTHWPDREFSYASGSEAKGLEVVSDLIAYMMAVRSLESSVTDLEKDFNSRTSASLVNMTLNSNFVPKLAPNHSVMVLMLHNFARALKYDISNMVLTPMTANSSGSDFAGSLPGSARQQGPHQTMYYGNQNAALSPDTAKRVKTESAEASADEDAAVADLLNYLKDK
jgi:hypothetical protein